MITLDPNDKTKALDELVKEAEIIQFENDDSKEWRLEQILAEIMLRTIYEYKNQY